MDVKDEGLGLGGRGVSLEVAWCWLCHKHDKYINAAVKVLAGLLLVVVGSF